MPDVQVEVDAETEAALQTECELLGFDGPDAYLAWIVENRAAIEQGTESAELLAAYRERLAALEARLEAVGIDPDGVDPNAEPSESASASAFPSASAELDSPESEEPTDASATETTAAAATADAAADAAAADATADRTTEVATADATDAAAADTTPTDTATAAMPTAETHTLAGSTESSPDASDDAECEATDDSEPDATDDTGSDATDDSGPVATDDATSDGSAPDASPAAGVTASDGGTRTDADITSMHLSPERVQRVNEDPVARDAGELSNVTTKRVDEFSRRAVAETREQLDRDVETGLSYESSAAMSSDVRPGEDLADLDAIEVPGRSEELVAERREVVGRALAHLRDEGSARRAEFVDELYEAYPAGYETADGWWRCVREGLSQVDAVDGGHVWEYVG